MEKIFSEKSICKIIAGLKIKLDLLYCKPKLGLNFSVNFIQDEHCFQKNEFNS